MQQSHLSRSCVYLCPLLRSVAVVAMVAGAAVFMAVVAFTGVASEVGATTGAASADLTAMAAIAEVPTEAEVLTGA
ncbi:MAG TPA: hypothetical protein VIX19_19000, partial [Terriglobales bacterium]